MGAEVVPAVFNTGPSDVEKALFKNMDIYATTTFTPSKPQPEAKEGVAATASKVVADVKDVVGSVTGAAKELQLSALVKAGLKGDEKTEKAILEKMKDATDGAVAQVEDLKKSVVKDILATTGIGTDKVASLTQMVLAGKNIKQAGINALLDANPKVQVLYNAATLVSGADLSSTKGIMSIVGAISGNSALAQVLDMEGTFKVMGRLTQLVAKAEMAGEFIDKIMDKIHGHKNKKRFAVSISRDAFMSGNLPLINRMLDYAGVHAVLLKVPDAVRLLLMNYRLPTGTPRPTIAHYNALVNTMNRLDANWALYKRDGVMIPNLAPFTYMSRDTERTLAVTTVYQLQLSIARKFPSRNLPALGKVCFPLVAY